MKKDNRFYVGPSTGWLYGAGIMEASEQIMLVRGETRASAIEICLGDWETYPARLCGLDADFRQFEYCSMHYPDVTSDLRSVDIGIAKSLADRCGLRAVVTHPVKVSGEYPLKAYEAMKEAGLPLGIENMDVDKDSGYNIAELCRLLEEFDLHFVLDVIHAYEHDPTMNYARELYQATKERLVHLHVSGHKGENRHSLLIGSEVESVILSLIGEIFDDSPRPLILEGKYERGVWQYQREIEFLIDELGCHDGFYTSGTGFLGREIEKIEESQVSELGLVEIGHDEAYDESRSWSMSQASDDEGSMVESVRRELSIKAMTAGATHISFKEMGSGSGLVSSMLTLRATYYKKAEEVVELPEVTQVQAYDNGYTEIGRDETFVKYQTYGPIYGEGMMQAAQAVARETLIKLAVEAGAQFIWFYDAGSDPFPGLGEATVRLGATFYKDKE